MPEPFLKNFLAFNTGNECPQDYIMWSGIAVLSAAVGPRFFLDLQYFGLFCDIYIVLVGESGNRKTFARDQAVKVLRSVVEDVILCDDSGTHQGITAFMQKDEQVRYVIDYTGSRVSYRPYAMFCGELANFCQIDEGMATFLTDISDKYHSGYTYRLKNELHKIEHPYFTMLACTVPEFILDSLKSKDFSAGFGRRTVFVCSEEMIFKKPTITPGAVEALIACKKRLREILQLHGKFTFEPEAERWFWNDWYPNRL